MNVPEFRRSRAEPGANNGPQFWAGRCICQCAQYYPLSDILSTRRARWVWIGHYSDWRVSNALLPRAVDRRLQTSTRKGITMTSTFELALLDVFQFLIDNSEALLGLLG